MIVDATIRPYQRPPHPREVNEMKLEGMHHITMITADAQKNVAGTPGGTRRPQTRATRPSRRASPDGQTRRPRPGDRPCRRASRGACGPRRHRTPAHRVIHTNIGNAGHEHEPDRARRDGPWTAGAHYRFPATELRRRRPP